MASAMARFLYTLRYTDAAPAATNGHDRATLAHAHEFSDRTATARSCSQDRNTHRAWRNAETTARTNKHHDRRDNCATNTRQCCYFAARAKSQHSKHSTAQQHVTAQHSTAQTAQHSTAQQHSQHSTVQHAKPCALKHCNKHPVANTPPRYIEQAPRQCQTTDPPQEIAIRPDAPSPRQPP